MSNKDTIIEALTMQLRLEREGNLALAKREWIGLTEEDAIDLLSVGEWEIESTLKFAKSIEAKLKEKNA